MQGKVQNEATHRKDLYSQPGGNRPEDSASLQTAGSTKLLHGLRA